WKADGRLLDIGCGSGLLLAALGDDVRQRLGCDLRRDLYVQVRERVRNVLFAQADGMQLPFPDRSFDLVTCLAVIEELIDWQGALQEMARCVAPGGVLYVTVTNGRLLMPWYRFVARLGIHVRPSWWAYGLSSLRLPVARPGWGFGVPAVPAWRSLRLTPYLTRSQWCGWRHLAFPIVDWCMRRFALSFGFAWQRPLQDVEMQYAPQNT